MAFQFLQAFDNAKWVRKPYWKYGSVLSLSENSGFRKVFRNKIRQDSSVALGGHGQYQSVAQT